MATKKKSTKKVVKRSYKKKFKPEVQAPEQRIGNEEATGLNTDNMNQGSSNTSNGEKDYAGHGSVGENPLKSVHVFDLRTVNKEGRLGLLIALLQDGYLGAYNTEANLLDFIPTILVIDALELNHNNKLIRSIAVENIEDSTSVSVPKDIKINVSIGITPPRQGLPKSVLIGGTEYKRAT